MERPLRGRHPALSYSGNRDGSGRGQWGCRRAILRGRCVWALRDGGYGGVFSCFGGYFSGCVFVCVCVWNLRFWRGGEDDMANCKLEKGWDSWAVGRRGAASCLSCHGDDDALGGRLVRLVLRSPAGEVPGTSQCKPSDLQGSPAFPIASSRPRFNRQIHPAPSPSKHQTPNAKIIESNASPEIPCDQ